MKVQQMMTREMTTYILNKITKQIQQTKDEGKTMW